MTKLAKSLTIAAMAVVFGSSGVIAASEGISVQVNQAKIVKLARPADTIVVGNPKIADASVKDSTTIVLTGKGFGVTNLVILDEAGQPIIDQQVSVSRNSAESLRVYRRAAVQTLHCAPVCEAAFLSEAERQSDSPAGQMANP